MVVMTRILLCGLLLSSLVVRAQDSIPSAPDPAALESNWWSYFRIDDGADREGLMARIDRAHDRLKLSIQRLDSTQRTVLAVQVSKIHEGLKQMQAVTENSDSGVPVIPAAAASYTVDAALKRYQLWRKLDQELDLEQQDLDWQTAQLALERKRQTQRRSDYLKFAPGDPQRLVGGIRLMASRVSLELATLQNKRRETRLRDSRVVIQRLEDELKAIPKKLISATEDDKWLKLESSAQQRAKSLQPSASLTLADESSETVPDPANSKRLLLMSAETETQANIARLEAARYKLMYAISSYVDGTKPTAETNQPLLDAANNYNETKQAVNTDRKSWKSLAEQARKFASAQLANISDKDQASNDAYRLLLKQVDTNDKLLRDLQQEMDTGRFLLDVSRAILKDNAGWFAGWSLDTGVWLSRAWDRLSGWANASLFEINEAPVTTLGLLRVILIISIAWFISKLFRRGLGRLGQRKDGVSTSSLYTLGRVIHYIILVVGFIIGLSSIGIDFTKFALFASALGVGIGFGLQNLISNFVAGLMILFEKSLKVGDFVELSSGLAGEVKEINMRSTLITTNDNVDILVPNSEFVNNQVTNWTLRDTIRRIHVPFGVAYGTDKELVKKAVLEAADAIKWTLNDINNRQPQIWFVEFGDSSLNFELVVWLKADAVKRPGAVQAAYLWEIESKLKEYGIEIPFPQRDLHLRSVFGQKDEAGLSLLNK